MEFTSWHGVFANRRVWASWITKNLILFWHNIMRDARELAQFAVRLLSIHPTSADAERCWSVVTNIHTTRRNRLTNECVKKIATIKWYISREMNMARQEKEREKLVDQIKERDNQQQQQQQHGLYPLPSLSSSVLQPRRKTKLSEYNTTTTNIASGSSGNDDDYDSNNERERKRRHRCSRYGHGGDGDGDDNAHFYSDRDNNSNDGDENRGAKHNVNDVDTDNHYSGDEYSYGHNSDDISDVDDNDNNHVGDNGDALSNDDDDDSDDADLQLRAFMTNYSSEDDDDNNDSVGDDADWVPSDVDRHSDSNYSIRAQQHKKLRRWQPHTQPRGDSRKEPTLPRKRKREGEGVSFQPNQKQQRSQQQRHASQVHKSQPKKLKANSSIGVANPDIALDALFDLDKVDKFRCAFLLKNGG